MKPTSAGVLSGLVSGLIVASSVGFAGCAVDEPETSSEIEAALCGRGDAPVFLDQGWSAATRAAFYQTSQGSRMLPYAWFLNLEQAGKHDKLRSPSNMRRMGFLVDGPSATNPDGLPVGFARDDDPTRGAAVGVTCAACHTGELEVDGRRIRIDGGQSHADLEQLQAEVLASLEATLANPGTFHRFASGVLGRHASRAERDTLRAQVEQARVWWTARTTRSRGLTPHGPTRTDAFTIIGNEVACDLLGIPANCAPAIAPTEFPYLWGTPDFDWVQYNSSVHSPLGRNVGEVTGVFAESRLAADGTVDSTARLRNLDALEGWIKSLRAPAWPEAMLGPIDHDLAAQGAAIYARDCAGCHPTTAARTSPNLFGMTFARVSFATPLSALGTDPTAAMAFATRRADPGPWRPIAQAKGLIGPDGKASVAALLSISGNLIISKFFAVNGFTDLQKLQFLGFRENLNPTPVQLSTYKARPLAGVAFTAPYLHNGSVASLYELLLPPAQRKQRFYVGSKEFDPTELGYSTERVPGAVLLDTRAVGNSNSGHTYGTTLCDDDRMALLEYVKTL
jgi:mono/diheme cytochrome c family protein